MLTKFTDEIHEMQKIVTITHQINLFTNMRNYLTKYYRYFECLGTKLRGTGYRGRGSSSL